MADHRNLIHRDDLPMELFEKLSQELPGIKVVCAGDVPPDQLPQGVLDALEELKFRHTRSLALGRCIDCDAQMPGYPPEGQEVPSDWEPVKGWSWFTESGTDIISCWQCPACDAKEKADGE